MYDEITVCCANCGTTFDLLRKGQCPECGKMDILWASRNVEPEDNPMPYPHVLLEDCSACIEDCDACRWMRDVEVLNKLYSLEDTRV